jgi:flagellar motor protein MotB
MFSDNLALSSARAVAVARVLKREGELQFIQANGLGDSMPIADNQTPEGREANRRVEITLQQGTAKQQSLAIESTGESNG